MANKIKGVTCRERNGTQYWYARVRGQRVYCGKGDDGLKLAEAARSKEVAKRYENREMNAGLKVKKVQFKTVRNLANWYMKAAYCTATEELWSQSGGLCSCPEILREQARQPCRG